jgi:hypothetical protein
MTEQRYSSVFTGAQMDEGTRKSIQRMVGSLFVSQNEVATSIVQAETYYPVTALSTPIYNGAFTASNSRLTLTADRTAWFMVVMTACLSLPDQNIQLRMRIGKNGDTLPQSCAQTTVTGTPFSGRRESLATHTIVQLSQGDYIEAFIANWTNTADVTIRNMQFSAVEI